MKTKRSAKAAPTARRGSGDKVTVSLYPADHKAYQRLVAYLYRHGQVSVPRSRIFQVALRAARGNAALVRLYAEVAADDRRRRKPELPQGSVG